MTTKKKETKDDKRKYPLICKVCGTVARALFEGEQCDVCKKGRYEKR